VIIYYYSANKKLAGGGNQKFNHNPRAIGEKL
jgi:hypothetical protein